MNERWTLLAYDQPDIFEYYFSEYDGGMLVNPSVETVEKLTRAVEEFEDSCPPTQILASESTLKSIRNDFFLASLVADLVAAGSLEIRAADSIPNDSLLVTDDELVALVFGGSGVGGLVTDESDFVSTASEFYSTQWEAASEFPLRTPPRSAVQDSLQEKFGNEVSDDFNGILASIESARGARTELDASIISLLVAAKNELQLYELRRWGEDVGIASPASISRMKTELESAGLVGTEKVPVQVGRPRQRLKFNNEELKTADTTELAEVALNPLD
ncbi:transcriptional regulator TbsP domain-containing protein [Haladaptatus sp. NG-SE-30]